MATKARIKNQLSAEVLAQQRVISVGEARKLIGTTSLLTDEQLAVLVLTLEDIAIELLSAVTKEN